MSKYESAPMCGNPVHSLEEVCEKCIYLGPAERNGRVYDLWFHYEEPNSINNTVLIVDGKYPGSYRSDLGIAIMRLSKLNTREDKIESPGDGLYLECIKRLVNQRWLTTTGFSINKDALSGLRIKQKQRLDNFN